MTPYERVIYTMPPIRLDYDLFEQILIVCFWSAVAVFLVSVYSFVKQEMSHRQWGLKELVMHTSGLAYIKKWLQNTLFLFVDNDWSEKQEKWIRERQKERKDERIEGLKGITDKWSERSLKREKDQVMKPVKTKMKITKASAKYECAECGYKDRLEMVVYTDITKVAETFCFKKICQGCKSSQLKIVMLECELFKRG